VEEGGFYTNDIKGEQETFEDIFDKTFEVVSDKKNINFWTAVYEIFSGMNETDFNIKYKLSTKGIECKQDRGNQGRVTYFKGLLWKQQEEIIDDN